MLATNLYPHPSCVKQIAILSLVGHLSESSKALIVRAASPERLALRLSELPAFFHRPDFCLDAALAPSASLSA